MISERSFDEVVEENRKRSRKITGAGYEFHDILYTLLFMACDFLFALLLTLLSLLDVKDSCPRIPTEAPSRPVPDFDGS